MTALQTKRSAKSKLTKEEKIFYRCCRERRSYAQNQDLDTVVCPICGSVKVIKNGTRNGRQRYFCKDCKKTFGDTNGTVAFRSKMSIGKWIEFIKLTLQGESCRTIAKNLGINKQTALHNGYRISWTSWKRNCAGKRKSEKRQGSGCSGSRSACGIPNGLR